MKFWFITLILLTSENCLAGFVTIDEFTDSAKSDHLGIRTTDGITKYVDNAISMVSGHPESDKVVSLHYSFLPEPLVVKPKFVLTAKNNQTTYEESGWLRVSINNLSYIQKELFAKQNYELLVFDFTDKVPASETISELRVEYLRPDGTTGARELLIDSIVVSDVPEPRTYLLILLSLGGVGCYQLRKIQTERKSRRKNAKRLYRYRY